MHQALKDATDGAEPDEASTAAYFLFAGVVHETAHWIAAQVRPRLLGNAPRSTGLTEAIAPWIHAYYP